MQGHQAEGAVLGAEAGGWPGNGRKGRGIHGGRRRSWDSVLSSGDLEGKGQQSKGVTGGEVGIGLISGREV